MTLSFDTENAINTLIAALREAAPDTVALVCQVAANALRDSSDTPEDLNLSHAAQVAATVAMRANPLPNWQWAATCLGTPGARAQEYAERDRCPEWIAAR